MYYEVKTTNCRGIFTVMMVSVKGRILSPILFSLFLNDLVEFISHGYDGLHDITDAIHLLCDSDDTEVYFKLYLLLYGDDTVILAETQEQLQAALNSMFLYCQTWKLEVNPTKTKIVIFGKRKVKDRFVLHIMVKIWLLRMILCI